MKKLTLAGTAAFLLAASILAQSALGVTAEAAAPADVWEEVTYQKRVIEPEVDRVTIVVSGGESPSAFYGEIYNGTTYAPLREFSIAMGATSVIKADDTMSVTAPGLELTATAGDVYICANGRYLYVPNKCVTFWDNIYVPVRVIAEAFGSEVEWSQQIMTAYVTSGGEPISSEVPYSSDDLYWMSRIITAEARGESFEGMLAVGNVIMNRIDGDYYPDTVYSVVFDGIQFTPTLNGAIYNTPTEECTIAAKLALEGAKVVGDCLYFTATTSCWAAWNREYYGVIGGHYFYL